MPATDPRLTWTRMAPEPDDMYSASLGQYVFEISATTDNGLLLQVWQLRSEDWPLVVWEMDGFSLQAAKDHAERLANQHVPVIVQDQP
jgi:hypothetical protein